MKSLQTIRIALAYLAFNAVHAPLQAPADEVAKFNTGEKNRDTLLAMGKRMDGSTGNVVAAPTKLHRESLEQMPNPNKAGPKKWTAEQNEAVGSKKKKADDNAGKKAEKRAQNKAGQTNTAVSAATKKRPNVLFVISDDLGPRIGPAGDNAVMTPVLDRLAGDAMTFHRAYCQYPVCGPSRASFLSGLYPQSTGILDNETKIDDIRPGTPSIPEVFRQAGYWTAAVGKVFHKPLENPGNDTWDQVLAFENDETAIERAAREKFEKEHGPVTGKNRKIWREHLLTVAPQTRNQGVKGIGPGYGPTGLRDDQHADGKNARKVAEWITTRASADKPFMIACGFHKPHIPFLAPDAYFAKYPMDSIKLSRSPANDWDDIPMIAMTKQYKDYGFPDLGKDNDARRREFMQAYYACVSFIDAQFGLIVEALHKSGEWENTIIVFVGDHGYHLGEHFMWGKVHLFEESARMPFMVRVPGVTTGAKNKGLVEMVDIFPTLAELCDVAPPANLQGRSLVPMLQDPAAPGKEYAYTVVKRRDSLGLAVRFGNWRYTEWGSPDQAELYDLNADPQEFTNLVGKKESANVLARARQVLAKAQSHAKSQFLAQVPTCGAGHVCASPPGSQSFDSLGTGTHLAWPTGWDCTPANHPGKRLAVRNCEEENLNSIFSQRGLTNFEETFNQ